MYRLPLVLALAGLASTIASAQVPTRRFDNHRIVQVDVSTPAQLDAIERLGGDILNCHPHPGPTDVLVTLDQLDALRGLGLDPRVVQDNVQGAVDRQKLSASVVAGADPFDDFFLAYHPYDGANSIVWYMNELVTRYPTLASMVNVGTTLEGRTIWGLRITSNVVSTKPAVVYFGCEHAREWIASTVPTFLATHLVKNYGLDSAVTDLVDNVEFFLIPVFNVDGYIYSWGPDRFWRKNRRNNGNGTFGVDINRNWGEGWGGPGSSTDGSSQTYRGPSAFSEPETRALRDFIIARPNIRASLDVHSYSQLILWPYGYTDVLPPDQFAYDEVGMEMRSLIFGVHGVFYNAGPTFTTIYPASGVSVDWTYAQRDIFSFSYELRDTGFYGFTLPAGQIIPNNEEVLPATLHMTDSDWVRSPMRFEFPNELPSSLTAGVGTTIAARIVEQTGTLAPSSPTLHFRFDPAAPFIDAPLTPLGGDNYQALIPATNCFSTPEYYFSAETTLAETVEKPRQSPTPFYYDPPVLGDAVVFYDQPLNTDPGWTRTGAWAFGTPTGGGGFDAGSPDPVSGYTGAFVFGYNLAGDYTNSMPQQHLTTTAINAAGRFGVHLSFRRRLGVESPQWDHAYVAVSNNGSTWTTVWENLAEVADSTWTLQDFDISAVADNQPTVYIRWTMGTTDTAVTYCGWNIDDVTLYATECTPTLGDVDGDTQVDTNDYPSFEDCFSGPGVPRPAGCRIFDFENDGDVDCADYSAFGAAWTAASGTPALAACPDLAPPAALSAGSRYLTVTPPAISASLALRVWMADQPCHSWYVDFDPDPELAAKGVGRLVAAPIYRPGSSWGTLQVSDSGIVPLTAYRVQTIPQSGGLVSPGGFAATMRWADLTAPLGSIDALDVVAAVDRFKSSPGAPPMPRCDLYPSTPDFLMDALDIVMVIDAYRGRAFPFSTPAPCPP